MHIYRKVIHTRRSRVTSIVFSMPPPQVIAFANWENKTADAIASRAGGERLRGLEGANAEALLARRHRLADLYNREMEQWEHEVRQCYV